VSITKQALPYATARVISGCHCAECAWPIISMPKEGSILVYCSNKDCINHLGSELYVPSFVVGFVTP
jgi:hypothetical protein